MKNLFTYLFYCFIMVFSSCNRNQSIDDIYINLSDDHILVDQLGDTQLIMVESTVDWDILKSSVPEWCNAEKGTDNQKDCIKVTISPNHTFQEREATIIILCGGNSTLLTVFQSGNKNSSSLDWRTFRVNNITKVSFEMADATKRCYRILGSEFFINPSMRGKVFHGNLINSIATSENGIIENKQYTYNPITISSLVGGRAYIQESFPSIENTNGLYNEINENYPKGNLSFSFQDTPIQYHSYKHLNLLGLGNLGLKLDEIIAGSSYLTNEMGDRTGLIYSYCNAVFSTDMDIPNSLVQEIIPDEEADKLSYISSIKYGKMALLIIETDFDYNISKTVIKKIMKDLPLDDEEVKVKESITAYYLTFDKEGNLNVNKGIAGVEMYVSDINEQPIIPLSFLISNYSDNSVGELEFNLELP